MPTNRDRSPRAFQAPSYHTRSELTIKLPAKFAGLLHREAGEASPLYCVFVDGILQISGDIPDSTIPFLTAKGADSFIPQSNPS